MRKNFRFDFKAVLFDMDGVITNTMPYHFDAWLDTFAAIGIKVNCYDVYKREGQSGFETLRAIYKEHNRRFSQEEAKMILRKKEELFNQIVKIKFIKGAKDFVRKLKRCNFKLGLVTGTSKHEMERILPLQLRSLFDVIVTGCQAGKGKPHPEPFLNAVKRLGLPKNDIAVIENAPFGIQSAKKAGLYCIALETSLPRKYLKQSDVIFSSFSDLETGINLKNKYG